MLSSTSFYRLFSRIVALFLWKVFLFFFLFYTYRGICRKQSPDFSKVVEHILSFSRLFRVTLSPVIDGPVSPWSIALITRYPVTVSFFFFSLTVIKRIAGTISKDLVGVLMPFAAVLIYRFPLSTIILLTNEWSNYLFLFRPNTLFGHQSG